VHIEFQASGEARYGYRMLDYRVRLYARPEVRGKRLVQHVIMLADGSVDDGIRDDDLDYRYQVHYLREQPVEPFLADPELAPLAALAKVSDDERPAVLRKVAALIATVEDPELRRMLSEAAADLALLRLDVAIIKSTWEENDMSIPSFARALYEEELEAHRQKVREEALEEGREAGREEGREEGREQLVVGILRHRFGHDARIPALARQLAALDGDDLMRHFEQATSLDDLA
jgi:predicted transposase/invertase (TIGR01784 family)